MKEREELKKLFEGITEKGYCPKCDKETIHTLECLNPDITGQERPTFLAWRCNNCYEFIEIE